LIYLVQEGLTFPFVPLLQENAHFSISEALISAIEQVFCIWPFCYDMY